MARRRASESAESTFGSDSFLDVVANIVGILIILIVIVGVRIRHASPASVREQEARLAQQKVEWEKSKQEIDQANLLDKESHEKAMARREADRKEQDRLQAEHRSAIASKEEQEKLHEAERLRREKILAQYEAEAARLQQESNELARQLQIAQANRSTEEKAATDRMTSLQSDVQSASAKENRLREEIAAARSAVADTQKDSQSLLKQVEELRRKLAEVTRTMPATRPLKHYATPMSRVVRKKHVFFYLKGGRISYAFFDELLSMANEQVRGRMSPSSSRIEGSVGPIGAFRLRYTFSRIGISMSEQLSGPVALSYQATQIILKPDEELIGETVNDVFEPNSTFRLRMRSLAADKQAITLWVYGDSFDLANQVEEFCHDAGFDVVMMPLPDGHPVSLGPNGFSMDAR
ncbi:hypothetical protein K2X85_16670 [bacterium]|nr:hypothetical protein [bacterium]